MQYMKTTNEYGYLSYHHAETVTDETSEPLLIPNVNRVLSVSVSPGQVGGESVTVQFTVSHPDAIKAAAAVWHDLESGPITAATLLTLAPHPTAIRFVGVGTDSVEVYI